MKNKFFAFGIGFIVLFLGFIIVTLHFSGRNAKDNRRLKIGLVLNGTHDDRGLSQVHYDPLYDIAKKRDLVLEYYENVPYDSRAKDTLEELVDDGCGFIVVNSAYYEDYVREASFEHPDVCFVCFYGKSFLNNFLTFSGRLYQAHYLTGIVAGLQTDTGKIGYFSENPDRILICGVNAFTLGVKKANPFADVILKYRNEKEDSDNIRELKEKYNIDVLACDGNSDSALVTADKLGIGTIGIHLDNSSLYPHTYLTAAVWDFHSFYDEQISNCEKGVFRGDNLNLGIDDDAVDIAPLTKNVKDNIEEILEAERDLLKKRKTDVFYGPIFDRNGEERVFSGESMPDREVLYNQNWYVSGVKIDE